MPSPDLIRLEELIRVPDDILFCGLKTKSTVKMSVEFNEVIPTATESPLICRAPF
jgi:hypothetical protein